jgi:hypothetical protein
MTSFSFVFLGIVMTVLYNSKFLVKLHTYDSRLRLEYRMAWDISSEKGCVGFEWLYWSTFKKSLHWEGFRVVTWSILHVSLVCITRHTRCQSFSVEGPSWNFLGSYMSWPCRTTLALVTNQGGSVCVFFPGLTLPNIKSCCGTSFVPKLGPRVGHLISPKCR